MIMTSYGVTPNVKDGECWTLSIRCRTINVRDGRVRVGVDHTVIVSLHEVQLAIAQGQQQAEKQRVELRKRIKELEEQLEETSRAAGLV